MVIVETDEVELSRPVRLIHPRWPLYVIPREHNRFMLGATSIEARGRPASASARRWNCWARPMLCIRRLRKRASSRSVPGLRPAFADNLPRIAIEKARIAVNGLYRHGFLLAPALAELTLGYVERGVIDNEVMQCA